MDAPRFGRLIQFDERSRAFPLAAAPHVPRRVKHRLYGRKLDQGSLGACVGFAYSHTYNGHPRPPIGWQSATLNAIQAQQIYSLATSIDIFEGRWPEEDTGTSVLAGCKAAQRLGWCERYEWAFGLDHLLLALTLRPLLLGTWWYSGMDASGTTGLLTVEGRRLGGHAWCATGFDDDEEVVFGRNSWGQGWGRRGNFVVTYADLRRLLDEDGEACAPVATDTV